jgi:hypothetical protein
MRGLNIITRCACAGAIALVGAGCGSSSSSSGLSKAQLKAKVEPLCASYITKGKAISVPTDFTSNPVSAASYLDKVVALVEPLAGQIKALTPDSSVKADYNAWVQAFTHDIDLIKTAAAKAHAADRTGLETLNQEAAYDRTVTRPAATKLGFTGCSQ